MNQQLPKHIEEQILYYYRINTPIGRVLFGNILPEGASKFDCFSEESIAIDRLKVLKRFQHWYLKSVEENGVPQENQLGNESMYLGNESMSDPGDGNICIWMKDYFECLEYTDIYR